MKGLLTSIESVTKVDDKTVHVKTKGPTPLLVNNLTNTFIMDKEWTEANNATKTQDFKAGEENFAVRNTNGTGAFQLVSREPDVKTVLKRNDNYWGKGQDVPLEVTEIVYTPIKSDATRMAALLSGEVDFVQDVPVQDIERLKNTPNLRVTEGPENRTIFFGLNVSNKDLTTDNVQGKNPFADKRVRQAMNMAINRQAIQRVVMRGQSVPTGVLMPPFVNGWTPELDKAPAPDIQKVKALLKEAGYENGFQTTMHCPNDRYVNDEGICQAVVGMLGQAGIITREPTETNFFLYGWGVPTFDSEYIFTYLYHSRTGKFGANNGTYYSNPEIDKKIVSLATEIDVAKRNATIADIWKTVHDEAIYLPVHHQMLAYGMKNNLEIPVDPENQVKMKYVAFKGM
jgi:peptide/nickel transport system substrate-binding protein